MMTNPIKDFNTSSSSSKRPIILKISLILLILIVGVATISLSSNKKKKQLNVPVVQIAKVKTEATPILLQVPGSIEAEQTVSIVSQVSGILKKIAFQEGQEVTSGQLLFEIDPATFEQSLSQAKDVLLRDEATLQQNKRDAERYVNLAKMEYVTPQLAEQAVTAARAQEAVVAADKTLVEQAEIQLNYTRILAPLNGKTGNVITRIGDLIPANSTTPLVIINQLDGVLADFHLTQDQLDSLLDYQKKASLKVEVLSEDKNQSLGFGELVFVNNQVDQQSGTVLLKAKINNAKHSLWPGMNINIKMILAMEPNTLVIPVTAIQYDQEGSFVYCMEDNKAKSRRIEIARQIDNFVVIAKGLKDGEIVLVSLPPDLTDNSSVRVEPTQNVLTGKIQ